MPRARVTAIVLCVALALIVAAVDVTLLVAGNGNATTTRSPQSSAPLTVGAPNAPTATCNSRCTPHPTAEPAPTHTATPTATAPTPSHTSPAATTPTTLTAATVLPRPHSAPTSHKATPLTPPKHVLAGYWENFVNNTTPLRLASVPVGYSLVDVAFAAADTPHDGGVTFNLSPALARALGGYTTAQFTTDLATLHARGQRVLISVNSAGGAVSINSPSTAAHFAESISNLITTYGFDGVDIDFENGLNVAYTAQALRTLAALRPGVLITLAPQTADMETTAGTYFQLALSIKPILTISFTQYYNSGTMLGCDRNVYAQAIEDFITALACTQLRGGLNPSQVGLGLPAAPSAAKHGYVAPSVLDNALDCLATGTTCGHFIPPTTWPTIGGAMTWSINWDASNSYAFLRTVGPHLASLP